MAYLMHIAFDNSRKLSHRVYYFTYRNTTFKLIQHNPHRFSNALLAILPSADSADVESAYQTAEVFLSSLSWENNSQVTIRYAGGHGTASDLCIKSARCSILLPPAIPTHTSAMRGFGIGRLPLIENGQQLGALEIWREATASSSELLTVILCWQILETDGTHASGWIEKRARSGLLRADVQRHINDIKAKGFKIGEYLENNCRHAIAHLKRRPGKPSLALDSAQESLRIRTAALILTELSRDYIRNHLGLNKSLWLVGIPGKQFSEYVDEAYMKKHPTKQPSRLGEKVGRVKPNKLKPTP